MHGPALPSDSCKADAGQAGFRGEAPHKPTFMRSLICNVPEGVQLLTCSPGGAAAKGARLRRASSSAGQGATWQRPADVACPHADVLAHLESVCVQVGSGVLVSGFSFGGHALAGWCWSRQPSQLCLLASAL